jgi:tetratricopeptide (TPR) repeat protein
MGMGDYVEALAAYEKSLVINPDNPTAQVHVHDLSGTPGNRAQWSDSYPSPLQEEAKNWDEAIRPAPEKTKLNKPLSWFILGDLGAVFPISPNLQSAYEPFITLDLGLGYKITKDFSFCLDFGGAFTGSQNSTVGNTNINTFDILYAAFWARYRIPTGLGIDPYFFIGPGITHNEYSYSAPGDNDNNYVDYGTSMRPAPHLYHSKDQSQGSNSSNNDNSYTIGTETDFLMEGGLGFEVRVSTNKLIYLQGKLTYDYTSPYFANLGSTDSPIVAVPAEFGLIVEF